MHPAPLHRRLAPAAAMLFTALVLNYLVVSTPVSGAVRPQAPVTGHSPAR
jgi:hypothetical protein